MTVKKHSYTDVRLEFKDGDILLFQGKSLYSRIMKLITHSKYSHSGIVIWWNERLMCMDVVARGVIVQPLSRKLQDYKGEVDWFSTKKEVPLTPEKRKDMVIFAQQELGKNYAFWRVFWLGVKTFLKIKLSDKDLKQSPAKLYCAMYVSETYKSVGLDLDIHRANRNTTPGDIAESKLLEMKGIVQY
jgi:hypothetical protein